MCCILGGVGVELPVVEGAFCGCAQDGVGFGDGDEALGGEGVVGVEVRVVRFGEGVE